MSQGARIHSSGNPTLRWHSIRAQFLGLLLPSLLALTMWSLPGHAQAVPVVDEDSFRRKEQQQIPWRLTVAKTSLGFHQRPQVEIEVVVSAASLLRTGGQHDLVLFVRVFDARTSHQMGEIVLRVPAIVGMPRRGQARLSPGREIVFKVPVMLMPGNYTLGIVLWDRVTGRLSIARKPVTVKPLKNDPLPLAWRNLPPVEFLVPAGDIDLDTYYGPSGVSRLNLGLNTTRRLNVELVGNHGDAIVFLPLLRVLSELHIPNGSLRVSILDLRKRQIIFQQDQVKELDWPRLRSALDEVTTEGFSLECGKCPIESARFFRDFLAAQVCSSSGQVDQIVPTGQPGNQASDNPVRVLILLTPLTKFEPGWKQHLSPHEQCRAKPVRVFQILYYPPLNWDPTAPSGEMIPSGTFNEWASFFEGQNLRVFRVFTPADLRKALAAIISDISKAAS
jgi:hypothetical protein